jgi:cysteinyl-tRNA synthetase
MADDLNISEAMGAIHTMVREINIAMDQGSVSTNNLLEMKTFMKMIDQVLNLLHRDKGTLDAEVELLIAEREQARKDKNFQRADEIRNQLQTRGIILEDTPGGTRWKKI